MTTPYAVAQLGARMHYAVPRILHAAGRLARLDTDICATSGWPRLLALTPPLLRPAALRRLLARRPAGIPARAIRSFPAFGREYARRRSASERSGNASEVHVWAGRRFCELVLQQGLDGVGGVYGFNSAAQELLTHARERGMRAVVEQTMAPHLVEHEVLAAERLAFPGWEGGLPGSGMHRPFAEREAAEWNSAELILCGSSFVRDSIAACGGPANRCRVIPYGVDPPTGPSRRTRERRGPLRVLVVGAVGLRKGSPYVLAAATALAGTAIIRMVGPLPAASDALAALRQSVELHGPVPRPEMAVHYGWADVFLLPSLCEGSATAVYEAMAWGLPVICTHSTGSVVVDGHDGFLVPARSMDAIVDRVRLLARDEALLRRMAAAASSTAADHTLERYGQRLLAALP